MGVALKNVSLCQQNDYSWTRIGNPVVHGYLLAHMGRVMVVIWSSVAS